MHQQHVTFEGFFYLWSEDTEVADDGWNWHDVNEEWSQQVVGEMGSNDWPEKILEFVQRMACR